MKMTELLTGLLVIITGFYAWVTYRILQANKSVVHVMLEQTEALMRPYIDIMPYVVPGTPIIAIRIKNTGRFPAKNLRLIIDKNFYRFGDQKENKNIAKFNVFLETIDMFSPGAELFFDLARCFDIFAKNVDYEITPNIFTITAHYEFFGKVVAENNTIDLKPLYESTQPRDLLVKGLKDIRESIEKLQSK
jgi:hypothetical protein